MKPVFINFSAEMYFFIFVFSKTQYFEDFLCKFFIFFWGNFATITSTTLNHAEEPSYPLMEQSAQVWI